MVKVLIAILIVYLILTLAGCVYARYEGKVGTLEVTYENGDKDTILIEENLSTIIGETGITIYDGNTQMCTFVRSYRKLEKVKRPIQTIKLK